MKAKYELFTTLLTSIKDKGIRYALIAILGAIVAKDIYVELVVQPQIEQLQKEQTIELQKENERLRTLLSTQSISLDYALNGDIQTAMVYKFADVSNTQELNDYIIKVSNNG